MKVVLVFRDKRKKGKSIEGVFQPLLEANLPGIQFTAWEYNLDKNIFANVRSLLRKQADVYHLTGDINNLACFLLNKKIIITIHDIGRFKELTGIKKQIYAWWWIRWPIAFSRFVTVVSNFTKTDLQRLVPSAASKLKLIYNGYSPSLQPEWKAFNTSAPRILQVGTSPNKNLETLIRAADESCYTLAIIGPLTNEQQQMLKQYKIAFDHYSDLNHEDLVKQYKLADLLVFVSTHEGFGLPVIEAQAIGRPVITTRLTSIPEIAGEGAHFVNNPFDEQELRNAIEKIRFDADYQIALINAGFDNVKRFTNEKMIHGYQLLYEQLRPS